MAEKTKLFYMKINWPDYHADTQHLDCCEHGAYFLLISRYWMTQQALPDSDRMLAKFAKCSPEQWAEIRPVLEEFFILENNSWKHKRIEE